MPSIFETIKIMRLYLSTGMNAAVKSYKLLSSDMNERTLASALAHLNHANTQITAAQTIYQLKEPDTNAELEEFFFQFYEFNIEFLDSIESSTQWTQLELEKLIRAYNKLPDGLGSSIISHS